MMPRKATAAEPASSAPPSGGRPRPPKRYSRQLVIVVDEPTADRVVALANEGGVSQSQILREAVAAGLPIVEQKRGKASTGARGKSSRSS